MDGKRFIHSLRLQNFLSFGSEGEEIELQPLNVLIGANASGKSNLIEAFGILKALPTDLLASIRRGGGVSEFLWKGSDDIPTARIEVTVEYLTNISLQYRIVFGALQQTFEVLEEFIKIQGVEIEQQDVYHHQLNKNDSSTFSFYALSNLENKTLPISYSKVQRQQSILSQRKDPDRMLEITYLGNQFSNISLYRDWHIGRNSKARMPQQTDLPEHPLLEDGSNLGICLNNLQHQIGSKKIIDKLKKFYEEAEELTTKIYGGTVQIYIREAGLTQPIPATRLSDGTLHYLFLMALLLDPTPPPLICIEEPEIGLHPDMMSTIAEMLIEASQRTQIIVTTHSESLISSLPPESVLICEKDYQGTHLRRLDPVKLKKWMEEYSLGDIWRMGEIGGNRW
ncbi:AAA family ATPase [Chroococcidiopsis sp. CCNUC1]|jgi:predicted ATPase|uniref:AAA family ATPase n=1 Tax=Chroococcidiopsis sp. CCNUC1 TaxID=2653189 RepID=UPI0020206D4C|nr:AAA family ATPase [Chroococcidiopsis sp. CCNUC1]URD51780.1 AAA family ATPase [Chroococcidiopsis sp. CCNUC1]